MIPNLTTEQHREYLEKASKVRRERAIVRNDLKSGLMTFGQVLKLADADCQAVSNMRVKQVINSMPGYGHAKTQQLMRALQIADGRRIKGLGVRQRAALLEVLGC